MNFFRSSSLPGYLGGLLLIGLTTALLVWLSETVNTTVAALVYLVPIGFIAWRAGLGASVLSSLSAILAFDYFFVGPRLTFHVSQIEDMVALGIFLLEAVAISYWVARAQSSLREAQTRERETTHLYELSISLAALRNQHDIALTLAQHLQDIFQARCVEVLTLSDSRDTLQSVRVPLGAAALSAPPSQSMQLLTPRGQLGEIRVWQLAVPFTLKDTQLLQAFASIGALALERVRLAQNETRAHILEESDRLKSSLLSSVSHELRTPLATIKAAATSLQSGEIDWGSPASHELITAITEETDQLNRLVGNLLDMSRIEAGVLKPKKQWNTLAEILGAVLTRMRHTAQHHTLEIEVSDDLPLVAVDHMQLDQVFTNLLSNCIKYAPLGTTIRVQARPNVDFTMLNVQVSNEGPHVPDEHLTHIFDKFYRVTAADRVTGTGLGLSICKGVIEAHGGRIWAQNLSQGFAFNFTLPLMWDGARPKLVE